MSDGPVPSVTFPGFRLVEELPRGFEAFKVVRVVDGDTYKIDGDLDDNGELDSVRVLVINAREMGKGPNLNSRIAGAEWGGDEARILLKDLIEGQIVYIKAGARDSHKRILSPTYIKYTSPPRSFVDISEVMMAEGWGEVFVLDPIEEEMMEHYLALQAWAKTFRLGVWKRDWPPLRITSFHADAKADPKSGLVEPLAGEYLRVVNDSLEPQIMGLYYLYNPVSERVFRLSGGCVVPPSRTVQIVTGGIRSQCDPEKGQIVLSLGEKSPIWENEDEGGACAAILDYTGENVVTSASKYGYAPCP